MNTVTKKRKVSSRIIVLLITILVCTIVMSILKPKTFFTVSNLSSSLTTVTFNLILACGMTIVLMLGCVDLSVGPIIAFISVIVAKMLQGGAALVPTLLAALLIGVLLGAVIMVVGYSLGRAFIYATPAAAIAKLPYQILQALVGAALGMVLRWKVKPLATLAGKLGETVG